MTASNSPSEPGPPVAERRRNGRVRLGGAVGALAMLLVLAPPVLRPRIGEAVFDLYQRLHPRDLTDMRAQVVAIDAESLRLIGPWPWSRYDLARLTKRIGDAGAVAIGFDMTFPEPDRQSPPAFLSRYPELSAPAKAEVAVLPSFDDFFAYWLGQYPTVLGRVGTVERSTEFAEASDADPANLPVDARFAGSLPGHVAQWPQAVSSLPMIEGVSAGHGLLNGDPDRDGIVRRVPAVGLIHGAPNTGFAVELARVALRLPVVTPVTAYARLTGLRLGDRTIPLDETGRYRLHFGRMPPRNVTSAVNVLRRGLDPGVFKGKVVILGVTEVGGSDLATTPLDARIYGIFVQAQAVDAVLRRGWLDRPFWAPAAELALGALMTLIAVMLVGRVRSGVGIAIGAVLDLAAIAGAWVAFVRTGILLDPAVPILIGMAGAAGIFVSLYAETAKLQRHLRIALTEERVTTARAAGEMAAARSIQRGMLPPRDRLAALDPRIEVDALLEPARAIGGDFYDAFALPDGRIVFLVGDVTGKGVAAALFMALSKALSRSALEQHRDDLGAAVSALSATLSRDNSEDMFVTLLIGAIDPATGVLTLVNAGHENPFVRQADGGIRELAMTGGPPVCVAEDYPYEAEAFALAPGDGLMVVTDGVTEAQNAGGGFFDRPRAATVLAALPPGWHARDATAALMEAVRRFEDGAEPSDDLTVLALRRPPVAISG